jgi:hypothetical protein
MSEILESVFYSDDNSVRSKVIMNANTRIKERLFALW